MREKSILTEAVKHVEIMNAIREAAETSTHICMIEEKENRKFGTKEHENEYINSMFRSRSRIARTILDGRVEEETGFLLFRKYNEEIIKTLKLIC